MATRKTPHCSFCGRTEDIAGPLLQGTEALICTQCAEQAYLIAKELVPQSGKEVPLPDFTIRKPKEIKDFLDQYVIGQDEAKRTLAVAVYNHYKRISQKVQDDEVEIEKSNIILVGETGTGKTLMASTIAKMLNRKATSMSLMVFISG